MARELQAMAQTGSTYASDPYDISRYHRLAEIASDMMSRGSGIPSAVVADLLGREAGHPTPKVDVRAAVFRDQEILLVRERGDGLWTLPGGWADVGESPSAAAARETLEESGYRIRILRLLAVYDRDRHPHPPLAYHAYKLFFEGDVAGGEPASSDETDAADFFAVEALPPLSTMRVTESQIARLFRLHRDPCAPADFD